MSTKNKAAVELGRRGGFTTSKKYGKKHYEKMAKARWPNGKQAVGYPQDTQKPS